MTNLKTYWNAVYDAVTIRSLAFTSLALCVIAARSMDHWLYFVPFVVIAIPSVVALAGRINPYTVNYEPAPSKEVRCACCDRTMHLPDYAVELHWKIIGVNGWTHHRDTGWVCPDFHGARDTSIYNGAVK